MVTHPILGEVGTAGAALEVYHHHDSRGISLRRRQDLGNTRSKKFKKREYKLKKKKASSESKRQSDILGPIVSFFPPTAFPVVSR